MKPKYDTAAHCKYNLQYHIIWCPKFRFSALDGPVADVLKDILVSICETYHYEIKALEVTPDHIHIFLSAPQTVAPCDIARTLKSRSAIQFVCGISRTQILLCKMRRFMEPWILHCFCWSH